MEYAFRETIEEEEGNRERRKLVCVS